MLDEVAVLDHPAAKRIVYNELWYRGSLRHLLRPNAQTTLYDFAYDWKGKNPESADPIIFNCHRRLGKSFLLALMCIERCLRRSRQEVKYGAPTYLQCRDITRPIIERILETCPDPLRPQRIGWEYVFRNPRWQDDQAFSTLKLIGCNVQDGDRLRGQGADMVVLDEVREVNNLEYIINDVLSFQFVGHEDPLLSVISTPPKSMDHDFVTKFVPKAIEKKSYMAVPCHENQDWSLRDERMVLAIVGSKETTGWRREALCELVADEEALIVPEFYKVENEVVVDHYERPIRFMPHMVMDAGWSDKTALLFYYIDFLQQTLVVEKTIICNYSSTGEIAEIIRANEDLLYHDLPYRVKRTGDCTPQQLDDLRTDHKIYISPAEKHDRDATIASLRETIRQKKIRIIKSGNEDLTYQLKNGIWNNRRNDFERSDTMGHWDAGMALAYGNRSANWKTNPIPDPIYDKANTFRVIDFSKHQSKIDALLTALGRKKVHAS